MYHDMKEKVIHTRVSNNLFKQLSKKADKLRINNSQLIRNILEDNLKSYSLNSETGKLGMHKIMLSKPHHCHYCNKKIKEKNEVFLEIYKDLDIKIIRCQGCITKY